MDFEPNHNVVIPPAQQRSGGGGGGGGGGYYLHFVHQSVLHAMTVLWIIMGYIQSSEMIALKSTLI